MVGRNRILAAIAMLCIVSGCASSPKPARFEEAHSGSRSDTVASGANEPSANTAPSPATRGYGALDGTAQVENDNEGVPPEPKPDPLGLNTGAAENLEPETLSLIELQVDIVSAYQDFQYAKCVAAAIALEDRDDAGPREKSEALIMAGAAAYLQGDFFLSRWYFRRANRYTPRRELDSRYFPRGLRTYYEEVMAGPPE